MIVFVTAFSDHAAKAFDLNALDYLLKPSDPERLAESLNRARDRLRSARDDGRRILAAVEELAREQRALRLAVSSLPDGGLGANGVAKSARRYPDRLLVSKRGHGVFVSAHTISYIESAGNYVRIHAGADEHRLRVRLSDIEQQLDPARFARIHRTIIVNTNAVAEIQPWFSGDAVVILRDGTRLRLSRHYRGSIEATFGLARGVAPDAGA